uniref:Uncharacterized protein n=1 Tax=Parascaris univalens TaxID=6257 RepID=A0A915BA86_PARUN
MGEAYEALGPVDSEPPPQPPATVPAPSPNSPSPAAQNAAAGTATGVNEGRTKPALGTTHENADFGMVSAYTLNSAGARPVISEHSDAPVIKQENTDERRRRGTVLLVIFSILFGVSAVGVIVCIALVVFNIRIR